MVKRSPRDRRHPHHDDHQTNQITSASRKPHGAQRVHLARKNRAAVGFVCIGFTLAESASCRGVGLSLHLLNPFAATRHRGAERVEPTLDDLGCRLHGISAQRGRECIHARLRIREAVDCERGAAGGAIERLTAQQRSSWAPIAAPQLTQSMLPFGCSSRAQVDARHRPHQLFLLQELRKRLVRTVPRETPELQRLTPARAVVHRL